MIIKGSFVSTCHCRPVDFFDFLAFCLQQLMVVVQTTTPPTAVTWLIAKWNSFTDHAKHDGRC